MIRLLSILPSLSSLTARLILMQWKNTLAGFCSSPTALCDKISNFIQQNLKYVQHMIEQYEKTDPFWYQVKLFYAQLDGLLQGYNAARLEPLSMEDLL